MSTIQIALSVSQTSRIQETPLTQSVVDDTQAYPSNPLAKGGSANRTRGTPVSGFWNRTRGTGGLGEMASAQMARAASPLGGVPISFSWTQHFNGQNYMTPVRDQGSCGSCWAFASIGGMESQYQINKGNPSTGIDLSEQNVLQCSGGSCSGWYLSSTLDFLRDSGTPDEACNPYTATDHPCGTGRCSDYFSRTYRVTSWSHISTDTANIKNYLYTHGPVLVWMPVFSDFPWYDAYFWQHYFYGHSPSGSYGGHLVVIVGWDDQSSGTGDDYWIVRNSWGTSGGDVNNGYGGYFYMTQDPTNGFFGIYQEAAVISDVSSPTPVTRTVTLTQTVRSTSYTTRYTTTTSTSYTRTSTSTSTIPTVTTEVLVPLTVTSTVHSTQHLTSILTTTVTSYTGTSTSTSTIPTTVALAQLAMTSTVQSTQSLTSILTTTVTSYTGTEASTSTIVVPTTVVLVPSTVTSMVQSTQYLTSTLTTTVTSYTSTTTSTNTSVVYTTVTASPEGAGAAATSPLAYVALLSLFAIPVSRVTVTKGRRIPAVRSLTSKRPHERA